MHVDPAGRDDEPGAIDLTVNRGRAQFGPDLGNAAIDDQDIGNLIQAGCRIDDAAIAQAQAAQCPASWNRAKKYPEID